MLLFHVPTSPCQCLKGSSSIQSSWPRPAHPNQCLPNSCFWAPASATSLWQKPQAILNKSNPKLPGTVHGSSLSLLQPVTVLLQGLDAVPDLAPHFPQLEERQVPLGLLNWNRVIYNCQRTTPQQLTTSCLATSLPLLHFKKLCNYCVITELFGVLCLVTLSYIFVHYRTSMH